MSRLTIGRLASPSATSVWTWMIAFAPSMTTAVLHDRNLFGGSVVAWLTAAVSGALAAGAVLALAHLLLRAKLSWVAVLATFLIAGCGRGLAVGWAALELGLVEDPQLTVRAASGAVLTVFWLSIATLIVDGYRTHRVTRLDVQERQRAVEQALNLSTHQLQTTREQTRIDVVPRMRILIAQLRELPSSAVAAAAQLTVIATTRVQAQTSAQWVAEAIRAVPGRQTIGTLAVQQWRVDNEQAQNEIYADGSDESARMITLEITGSYTE